MEVSYSDITDTWILGCDNFSIPLRNEEDFELCVIDNKTVYEKLKKFTKHWFLIVSHLSMNNMLDEFIDDIKGYTLIGSMVGTSIYYDLLKMSKELIIFHSVVKNNCTEYFIEVYEAYKLFIKYDLYYSPLMLVGKYVIPLYQNKKHRAKNPLLNVTGLDRLIITLMDLYIKEQNCNMNRNERGSVVHIYSYMVPENSLDEFVEDCIEKKKIPDVIGKNVDLHTKFMPIQNSFSIKNHRKSLSLQNFNLLNKSNSSNQDEFDNADDLNLSENEKLYDEENLNDFSMIQYKVVKNERRKKLVTCFQILNNEYYLFKSLHEELHDFVDKSKRKKLDNFDQYNSDNSMKLFISNYNYLFHEDNQEKRLPLDNNFYFEVIRFSFHFCIQRVKKIIQSSEYNKKLNECIYDAVIKYKDENKNVKFGGFTINNYNKTIDMDFFKVNRSKSKKTIEDNENKNKKFKDSVEEIVEDSNEKSSISNKKSELSVHSKIISYCDDLKNCEHNLSFKSEFSSKNSNLSYNRNNLNKADFNELNNEKIINLEGTDKKNLEKKELDILSKKFSNKILYLNDFNNDHININKSEKDLKIINEFSSKNNIYNTSIKRFESDENLKNYYCEEDGKNLFREKKSNILTLNDETNNLNQDNHNHDNNHKDENTSGDKQEFKTDNIDKNSFIHQENNHLNEKEIEQQANKYKNDSLNNLDSQVNKECTNIQKNVT